MFYIHMIMSEKSKREGVSIYMYKCGNVCVCVCVCVCMCVCVHVYVCACVCVCVSLIVFLITCTAFPGMKMQ